MIIVLRTILKRCLLHSFSVNSLVFGIFKIVKIEKNGGLGPALKLGVENCKNEWIARMDSDDYSPNDRIEKQFDVLKKCPDVGIVGSNADEFVDSIDPLNTTPIEAINLLYKIKEINKKDK